MKNKSKKLLLALYLSSIFSSVSFATEEEKQSAVSANITIANDYVWRGKTQSNNKKTIQGGLDWDAGNGFALGIINTSTVTTFNIITYFKRFLAITLVIS
jgi:uncharacterized protein (TIGR02001 family)